MKLSQRAELQNRMLVKSPPQASQLVFSLQYILAEQIICNTAKHIFCFSLALHIKQHIQLFEICLYSNGKKEMVLLFFTNRQYAIDNSP